MSSYIAVHCQNILSTISGLGGGTYAIRSIIGTHTGAIEQEPHSRYLLSLAITESVHQLLQWSRPLDFEKHFVVVIRDLDVEMLDWSSGLLAFRHGENSEVVAGWLSEKWIATEQARGAYSGVESKMNVNGEFVIWFYEIC